MDLRKHIEKIAREIVKNRGLINLSRSELCRLAGISQGSFSRIMSSSFVEFVEHLNTQGIIGPLLPVTKKRIPRYLRHGSLLQAAVECALQSGFSNFTRDQIAERAGASPALVTEVLGSIALIRSKVMATAVKEQVYPIIAEGIILHHPEALRASNDLKHDALLYHTPGYAEKNT